jgi:hypothetical protein
VSRRLLANIVSLIVGGAVGAAATGAYWVYLNRPRPFAEGFQAAAMDWAIDLGAGVTVGIIFFFISWGHFQQDDAPARQEPQAKAE